MRNLGVGLTCKLYGRWGRGRGGKEDGKNGMDSRDSNEECTRTMMMLFVIVRSIFLITLI